VAKERLVLFDIDGTLLLSGGAGRRAILAAFADEIGHANGVDHIQFGGKTDPQIAFEMLDAIGHPDRSNPERIQALLTRYVTHLGRELALYGHLSEVMPGILPLLDRLEADERIVLGLLTGNVSLGAAMKLRAVSLDPDRFVVGAFGSDHAARSELPSIAAERARAHFGRAPRGREVVIIGDTPADVTCGLAIGATSIAVATGGFTAEDLEAAGAHHVFRDLSDTARVHSAIVA
jgi:phosphoglycolate phosphatase-like HAD superfamily hydrolase